MKLKYIAICILLVSFYNKDSISQEQPNTTFYLKAPQIIFPNENFGFATNNEQGIILNGFGLGAGVGALIYPEQLHLSEMVHIGFDVNIAEINVIGTDDGSDDYFYPFAIFESSSNSLFFGSKLGPVITFTPADKFLIDIYVQGRYGLESIEYYDISSGSYNSSTQTGLSYAGGINMGWSTINMSLEYTFSQPQISQVRYYNNTYNEVSTTIHASYIKVSLMFKFNVFEEKIKATHY